MIKSSSASSPRYSVLHSSGSIIGCDCCHNFVLNLLFTCLRFTSENPFRQKYVWITNYYYWCYFSLGLMQIYTLKGTKWHCGTLWNDWIWAQILFCRQLAIYLLVTHSICLCQCPVYFKISAFKYLWDSCCFNYLSLWSEVSLLCWG